MIRKVLEYATNYKRELFLAILLIFISVVVGIAPYFVANSLIVSVLAGPPLTADAVVYAGLVIAGFLILKSVLGAVGITLSHKAAYGTLCEMRKKFSDKVACVPLGEITSKGSGYYKKRIVDDIGSLEITIAHVFTEGIPNIVIPTAVLVVIFVTDWRLGLLSLGSLPLSLFAMFAMMKTGMANMPKYYESQSRLNNTIVEYVSGMEVVKIFGHAAASYEKYAHDVEDYRKHAYEGAARSWWNMSVIGVVLPCTIVLTLPFGLLMYMNDSLSLDTLVFVLMLDLAMGIPLNKALFFMPLIPNLRYAISALEQEFDAAVIETGEEEIVSSSPDVRFENVTFSYGDKDVLSNINFTAGSGSLTAIIGPSGGGKSTVAKLLVHYWDVRQGSIVVGGKDVRACSTNTLMDAISFVSQDVFLFDDSIKNNIRVGKPDATDEEICVAARAAACHEFITSLPKGYETLVGTDGSRLSGGEKQRITLARAILKNAPIVVLDEATASMDAENEDVIQDAINSLISGKMVILIAHRLHGIVNADQILVMDKGKIVTRGKHDDLLSSCALYRKLWAANEETVAWKLEV